MAVRAGRLKVFVRGVDSLERIGVNDTLRISVVGFLKETLRGLAGEGLYRTFDGETGDGGFDWAVSEGLAFERKGETGIWLLRVAWPTPVTLNDSGVLLSSVTWVRRSLVLGGDETGKIGFGTSGWMNDDSMMGIDVVEGDETGEIGFAHKAASGWIIDEFTTGIEATAILSSVSIKSEATTSAE